MYGITMRPFVFGSILLLTSSANAATTVAETTYLGLFIQGQKIGYTASTDRPERLGNIPVVRSDSTTLMDAELIGTKLQMRIDSTTWLDKGRVVQMRYKLASGGLQQSVDAKFGATHVDVDVDNVGKKTKSRLPLPKDGPVIDDPVQWIMSGKLAVGAKREFYVFDPSVVAFVKNELRNLGQKPVQTENGTVQATAVEIFDPRTTTTVYLTGKGDLIKAVSGLGIEMRPMSKEAALAASTPTGSVDLAYNTSIRPDKAISNPLASRRLELVIRGRDLAAVPSDAGQTVTKSGDAWRFIAHPTTIDRARTRESIRGQQAEWLKPSLHIPSDTERFQKLAQDIAGKETTVAGAVDKIHGFVQGRMIPNAGMGVLRNANQVLESKEGVCRDYAILTATMLRAAGIPAKLAGGMIYMDGAFFYHAWAEAWDGTKWVGVDTTLPQRQLSAVHLKLGEGNVDRAFTFTFLEDAKIEVVSVTVGK